MAGISTEPHTFFSGIQVHTHSAFFRYTFSLASALIHSFRVWSLVTYIHYYITFYSHVNIEISPPPTTTPSAKMKTTIILTTLFSTLALSAPATKRQNNIQTFTGALGGVAATPIVDSGNANRPFQVKGDTFVNVGAAVQRSCDQQFNACANLANGGDATLSVSACSAQKSKCDSLKLIFRSDES
jgi:hypothetical protein